MSKMISKEIIVTTRPPDDVLRAIFQFIEETNASKEHSKHEFYVALNSDNLDIYTNMDERCREAWKIAVQKLSSPSYIRPTEMF
jgi:hypothetical protein